MSALIFTDKSKLQQVKQIIHPKCRALENGAANIQTALYCQESAIYLKAGLPDV